MVLLELNSFLITSLTLLADTINELTTHGNITADGVDDCKVRVVIQLIS